MFFLKLCSCPRLLALCVGESTSSKQSRKEAGTPLFLTRCIWSLLSSVQMEHWSNMLALGQIITHPTAGLKTLPTIKYHRRLLPPGFYSIKQMQPGRITRTPPEQEHTFPTQVYQLIRAKLNPPNEIVSESVKPDQDPPKLKLLVPKSSPALPRFCPPQVSSPKLIELLRDPGEEDTLLKYFASRESDLLYLRENNQESTRLQIGLKPVHYFAGHFEDVCGVADKDGRMKLVSETLTVAKRKKQIDIELKGPYYSLPGAVMFDSCFETGNLFAAFKIPKRENEFQLVMQNDVNSRCITQWFHFRTFLPLGTFTFNIINYTKNDSLFNQGMKVCVHSRESKRWERTCQKILYQPSQIYRQNSERLYYTLTFEYTNAVEGDVVTFANCYPCTYSQLVNSLEKAGKKAGKKVSKHLICKTLSDLDVFAIKVGDVPKEPLNASMCHTGVKKKSLVFMARQHPGETPGSLVLDGVIEGLLSTTEFEALKKEFVIYLIPMVNPDGVVFGSYRANLSGSDLNRKWRHPHKTFHPEVYHTRRFLSQINKETPIALIIDLHGHSRKMNSFFYGNPCGDSSQYGDNRLFPYICSLKSEKVAYSSCTFTTSEDKKNTARVVLNEMFPAALVYTFETSFFGYKSSGSSFEFTVKEFKELGRSLLESYCEYLTVKKSACSVLEYTKQMTIRSREHKRDDSGSDSEAEEEPMDFIKKEADTSIDSKALNEVTNVFRKPSNLKTLTSKPKLKRLTAEQPSSKAKTQDQSTQTEKKYLLSTQNLRRQSSKRKSQTGFRIFQMKSTSQDHFRAPQVKLQHITPSRNLTMKVAAQKSRLFGASFTMKLWNKGASYLSEEGKPESESELYKVLPRRKN